MSDILQLDYKLHMGRDCLFLLSLLSKLFVKSQTPYGPLDVL